MAQNASTSPAHTPGPWIAERQKNVASGRYEYVIRTPLADGDVSTRVIATTPYADRCNDHGANARLIAAAPELLQKLEDAVFQMESWGREHGDGIHDGVWNLIDEYRRVITKAKAG